MKIRLVVPLVALAISLAMPALAQEQNTVDPEVHQQIEAAHMKFEEAYNKHDAAAVAALFTPDAVEVTQGLSEGGVSSGQEAIRKRFEVESATGSIFSGQLVQVYTVGNDVCAITEYNMERHYKAHAIIIYVRDADEWKIRMQYVN
jgi:uncharacterized protein (TIGR02246 family)